MPTGVEEAVGVAAIAGVVVEMADKLSNAVQGIDTIVGWTKAQEGIKYNSHVFSFPTDDDKEGENSEPSSAASPKQPSDKSSSIAVSVPARAFRQVRPHQGKAAGARKGRGRRIISAPPREKPHSRKTWGFLLQ